MHVKMLKLKSWNAYWGMEHKWIFEVIHLQVMNCISIIIDAWLRMVLLWMQYWAGKKAIKMLKLAKLGCWENGDVVLAAQKNKLV